jgi:uncharacterized membrane protein YccC
MAAGANTTGAVQEGAWQAFRQNLVRFDRSKLAPSVAVRNTIGFAFPLVLGFALGYSNAGLVAAIGALNVSSSDKTDPYLARARRMIAASGLVGVAVFIGSLCGGYDPLAVLVAGIWAFIAGIVVALGSTAADVGMMSLVTLVVFEARQNTPEVALYLGLLALGGGLLQTMTTMILWPLRRYAPERRILAQLFWELARASASPLPATEAPPASDESLQANDAIKTMRGDHSAEADRYRSILNQAERLRLSLLALRRVRARLRREDSERDAVKLLNSYFEIVPFLLNAVGDCLNGGQVPAGVEQRIRGLQELSDAMRQIEPARDARAEATPGDARRQMDAMAGQIRAALDLASHATPKGLKDFDRTEERKPWTLRLSGVLATLGANLNFHSAAFRHALRLAVCVAFGDAVGRGLGLQRSYWLPMTIAIVLKPDFSATFSRGVLRLVGTGVGLLLATELFHALPSYAAYHITVVIGMVLIMRWLGPGNYGLLVVAVTAMIVFMIALVGVSPRQVMAARAWNTALGGLISLLAYWLWPTWEREHVREVLASLLDSYREYFRALRSSYKEQSTGAGEDLDRTRVASRLARSNAEASVDRMAGEPGVTQERLHFAYGFLAGSHRLAHAMMSLEAGLSASARAPARAAFPSFADDLETTLSHLAAALRGSPLRKDDLPDLRESHSRLVHSGDGRTDRYALVNVETDRITNSLNTLSELVLGWTGSRSESPQNVLS